MPAVHQQDKTAQRLADLQVFGQISLPLLFQCLGYLGVAETREVDQTLILRQFKKVDLLSTTRCFTGSRQAALFGDGIKGA